MDIETLSVLQKRFPCSYLVLLSDRFDFQIMLKAFRLGALAYIVKEISCDRLVDAAAGGHGRAPPSSATGGRAAIPAQPDSRAGGRPPGGRGLHVRQIVRA